MPQFEHLLFFMARQQSTPSGKKNMAQNTPKHGYESSSMPMRHAGQPPITPTTISGGMFTVGGCMTTLTGVASKDPYMGTC